MTKQSALRFVKMQAIEGEREQVYRGMLILRNAARHLRGLPPSEENRDAIELLYPLLGQLETENKLLCERAGELWEQILAVDGPELTDKELEMEAYKACQGASWNFRIWKRLAGMLPEQDGKDQLIAGIGSMACALQNEAHTLKLSQQKHQRNKAEILARRVLGYEH